MSKEASRSPLSEAGSWDLVSGGYEKYMRRFLGNFSERALKRLNLSEDHRLLDVACGPGTTSLLASEEVRSIEAIDFSEKMVDLFQSHLDAGSVNNVQVRVGDGQALPFDSASFERAVSMFGLMFFPDRVLGMRELYRTLVPDGRVLVASWAPSDLSPLMSAMFGAMRAANPQSPEPKGDLDTLENPDLFEREMKKRRFRQRVRRAVHLCVRVRVGCRSLGRVGGGRCAPRPSSEFPFRSRVAEDLHQVPESSP